MAHAVLGLRIDLAERPTERRIEKHRIVAEAALTARRIGDAPFHHAFHQLLASTGLDNGDHAAKACGAALRRYAAQALEEESGAARVVQAAAADARRVEAGPAIQRIDLDARIVSQRDGAGGDSARAGFDERIVRVGLAGLFGKGGARHVGQQRQLVRHIAEQRQQLTPLGAIERGDDEARLQRGIEERPGFPGA